MADGASVVGRMDLNAFGDQLGNAEHLMGGTMTRLTQMIIGSNSDEDVHLEHAESGGKHGFWITFGENHRPLLTSELSFSTRDEALSCGQGIITEARKIWAEA